ncbi:MAG: L-histidine N(alpha)-methyltransferase, partial [Myxococcales bacterium]|nr:L-histidine N(alpha)-methyltransferase [Myxococcales bacterium]
MLEAHGRARPQRRGEARRAVPLLDLAPQVDTFLDEVLEGLSRPRPRTLPCKFFYDRRGSQLFDQICELPEYYLTRTELEIMRARAGAMAAWVGPAAMVIEFGSGSSVKTRLLLDHLACPSAYVPVDISKQHLLEAAEQLAARYPDVEVLPVCADFTRRLELPTPTAAARRRVIYFPGSTIGN